MSKPQVKSTSLSLSSLMKIKSIKMPIFQRQYSWGQKGKTEKALEYFKNFLTSDKNIDFFGTFLFYSEDNISINSKTFANRDIEDIELYLADGQHRIITLYLAALAFSRNDNCPEGFIDTFKKITELNLEIIVETSKLAPVKINENLIFNEENVAINKSFKEIENYLIKSKQISYLASNFYYKIKNSTLSLNILMPNDNIEGSEYSIEDVAFDIFNQLNGQSIPLTPSELMLSILIAKHQDSKILQSLIKEEKNLKWYEVVNFYGLKDKDKILKFFVKKENLESKEFKWVNNLHQNGVKEIQKINNTFDYFSLLKDWIKDNKNKTTIKYLYEFYISKLLKTPQLVFIINNYDAVISNTEFSEKLFRLLILLEIMTTFKGKSTANISRDLNCNGNLDDILLLVIRHFGIIDEQNKTPKCDELIKLKIKIINHLKTYELGADKFINLSKIFLLINEIQKHNNFNSFLLGESDKYEYEHVWAKKYEFNNLEDIPQNIKNSYSLMQESPHKKQFINLIGNGLLLTKTINSSISNASPIKKLEHAIITNSKNHYWCDYFDDLNNTKGDWGISLIQKRTEEILINVISWLIDYFVKDKSLLESPLILDVPMNLHLNNSKVVQNTSNKINCFLYRANAKGIAILDLENKKITLKVGSLGRFVDIENISNLDHRTQKSYKEIYEKQNKLLTDKYLTSKQDGTFEIIKDFSFDSPSGASSFLSGTTSNGWTDWKQDNGDSIEKLRNFFQDNTFSQNLMSLKNNNTKSPATIFSLTIENMTFNEPEAKQTLIKAINHIGVDKILQHLDTTSIISEILLRKSSDSFIEKEKPYMIKEELQDKFGTNYIMYQRSSTASKIIFLESILQKLNMKYEIKLINKLKNCQVDN